MATLVFSSIGMAVGGSVGGSVLGVSSAAIGRAVGAGLGRLLDQRLLGAGSDPVETGRIDRFRLTGASEGAAIPQVYGRMRVAGHVIWATRFLETSVITNEGGKGLQAAAPVEEFSYSVSVAIAVCEGEVVGIGRVWADGREIDPESLGMRVNPGSQTQVPDAKIEAVQGADAAPAFRGTAYVVFEDLPLGTFGNRVPQFSFEVLRPAEWDGGSSYPDIAHAVQGVAMLPGSGEYALATTPVYLETGPGQIDVPNVKTLSGASNIEASVDALTTGLPRCKTTSLIVSWFGDDLRCSDCTLRPLVEQTHTDGSQMPWGVSGVSRVSADVVPMDAEGAPLYGGTPADASVIEAIKLLKDAGQNVLFYPFILMTQTDGNAKPDPWSGAAHQPVLPWRGRITTSLAPGRAGSPDGTLAANLEVEAFFGTANAADFSVGDGVVTYSGPQDWGMRRFILHYAALCAAAGGVESFCIGTEMRSLTQIRGSGGSFPAVAALQDLAAECRALLGPDVKLTYAADWSEYFGYQPQDGSGDAYFHLDPLWSDPNIDFIGIDNYMPLSDWRGEVGEADEDSGSIYNLDYLKSNILGGEGYDWFYGSPTDRDSQNRTPITDGYDEEWVWRYKDLPNWWGMPHHERVAGVRSDIATDWVPGMKPIRFTELGCAAIDKGTNQPNKFLDPKSSESDLPYYSNGARDDLIQVQYTRAMVEFWEADANNPRSLEYDGRMIDMSSACFWAWDARPYPAFPLLTDIWSDGVNYRKGHWINGRTAGRTLASVVEEICARSGVVGIGTEDLHGYVFGYIVDKISSAREALQPLMLVYGFDAVEREGTLTFFNRDGLSDAQIPYENLVVPQDGWQAPINLNRASEAEMIGRVELGYIDAETDYQPRAVGSVFPGEGVSNVSRSEFALAMTETDAQAATDRWLVEARVARDTADAVLPPSLSDLGAGQVIALSEDGVARSYRIDRVEIGQARFVNLVRAEQDVYVPAKLDVAPSASATLTTPGPVAPIVLDLPMLSSGQDPTAPFFGAAAMPWPGSVAVYNSGQADLSLAMILNQPTQIGVTLSPLFAAGARLWDRGAPLEISLPGKAPSSATEANVLGGANLVAIGDGTSDTWEIVQFAKAEPLGGDVYALSDRLRGRFGTEHTIPHTWPAGSYIVPLLGGLRPLDVDLNDLGNTMMLRSGPALQLPTASYYQDTSFTPKGIGHRPYAPVFPKAVPTLNGDLVINWIRRTRIGGDNWGAVSVPLSEANGRYVITVEKAGQIVRTEDVYQTSWTYLASDQSTDGLTAGDIISIAQVSDIFGPGPSVRLAV